MADLRIEVSVTGERLTLLNQPVLASGTVKAALIAFTFDDTWSGYSKIALFWDESDEAYACQVVSDLAIVPHEVVASSGKLRFGVYGVKGTSRLVSQKIVYDIADGAYTSVYDESTEPTPGILDQIEAMLATQGTSIQALSTGLTQAEACALGAYPTNAVSGAVVSLSDGADGLPVKALTLRLTPIQAGSGAPSPDNVRPISGQTGATVTRLGKNLAEIADNNYTSSGVAITVVNGEVHMVGTSTGTVNRTIGTVRLSAGVTYVISGTKASGISDMNVLRVDLRRTGGSVIASGDSYNGFTFSPTEDVTAVINIRLASGQSVDTTIYPQVEVGHAATGFEPCSPTAYAVDWSDAAGTVYGGTLDVTTGVLTVDRVMITIDGSDSSRLAGFSTDGPNFNRVQSNEYNDIGIANIIFECCDRFEPISLDSSVSKLSKVWNSASAPRMFFGMSKTVTTLDEAKAWFAENPTHVVARIALPQTYQLTPVEVLTLLGANTIYSNAGDLSLIYRADPTLFAARGQTEDDMTADAPIASSAYFQVGSTLYRATAAIATGETIIPGGNCVVTTLAEALNLLNA